MDAHALRGRGWTISAIARRLGRDRKTIRAYLNGERVPQYRRRAPDAFVPFLGHCRQRLADDPRMWASTLFDEVTELGYAGAYSTFTRALRRYEVRTHCQPCQAPRSRDQSVTEHPPGEENQFDRQLTDPPVPCGVGGHAPLLVGAPAHASRWRAVLAMSEDFPRLALTLDAAVRKLAGTTPRWRLDPMATVCHPSKGQIIPAFAAAEFYGVGLDLCPSQQDNHTEAAEKANRSAARTPYPAPRRSTSPAPAASARLAPNPPDTRQRSRLWRSRR